ncbi:hypothetical protein D3C86_1783870 [compost metagenome]
MPSRRDERVCEIVGDLRGWMHTVKLLKQSEAFFNGILLLGHHTSIHQSTRPKVHPIEPIRCIEIDLSSLCYSQIRVGIQQMIEMRMQLVVTTKS